MVGVLASAIGVAISVPPQSLTPAAVHAPFLLGFQTASQTAVESELRSLARAIEWINSPPLTAAELRGKVVLIDFWTYSCINWIRTVPYVRAWAEKYKDQGLVVIGAHTPEFGRRAVLTGLTLTTKATARLPNRGCIS